MGSATFTQIPEEKGFVDEGETEKLAGDEGSKGKDKCGKGPCVLLKAPVLWFRMLAEQIHWSLVAGVVIVYGVSQGLGGSLFRVASDYYWKDVQKVQPSESQVYQGITYIPWIVKPLWGLLTDILPVAGYRRRPYFILAGILGFISMLILSVHKNLHAFFAVVLMTLGSGGVAIADVTIDACVAQNSIIIPSLAADMQSLCGLSSSVGGLLGFSISGLLLYLMSSQGVLGLMCIPFVLVFSVGITLRETRTSNFAYGQVHHRLGEAAGKMLKTLKYPQVWRPCLYMYVSLALSLNIHEGLFYWITDPKAGPAFSQEAVGFILSVGSVGSLLGVLLYQNLLKDYPFRTLLFWTQLLYGFSGMLDLVLIQRLNLRFGIPDYFFAVLDASISQMVGRIKWMPLLVLSSKLCPSGIEGTFFALLMSIDNVGLLTSSWGGGLLLHVLKVTRTDFSNLWLSVLVRNLVRVLPLALLFLVPKIDQHSNILPTDILIESEPVGTLDDDDNIELASLVDHSPP